MLLLLAVTRIVLVTWLGTVGSYVKHGLFQWTGLGVALSANFCSVCHCANSWRLW